MHVINWSQHNFAHQAVSAYIGIYGNICGVGIVEALRSYLMYGTYSASKSLYIPDIVIFCNFQVLVCFTYLGRSSAVVDLVLDS